MNNPTALTDPLGLQGESTQTCGEPATTVPQGYSPSVWCYNHMGIAGGSSPGAFFTNPTNQLDLLEFALQPPTGWIPVSVGAQSGCPGCYYNPDTDQTWDPSEVSLSGFLLPANNGNNFTWWGAFGTSFVHRAFHARQPGQSFGACVAQNASLTLTGSAESPVATTVSAGIAGMAGLGLTYPKTSGVPDSV